MCSSPLVSVIIPTHNRPERLKKAIASVDKQLYENIELIIVDDASEVPAEEIVKDLRFENISLSNIHRFDENRGANAARNKGVDLSTGEYLSFLDDDDAWREQKISKQVDEFWRSDENVGLVYTGMSYQENGELIRERLPSISGNVTKNLLTGDFISPFSAIMVKSEVPKKVGRLDERFPSWQDREWYIRISKSYKFKAIAEPLTIHRVGNPDQITYNYDEKLQVSLPLLLEKHLSLAEEYGLFTKMEMLSCYYSLLGRTAMITENYSDARWLLLKSIAYNPLNTDSYAPLLATIGGSYTYKPSKRMKRYLSKER